MGRPGTIHTHSFEERVAAISNAKRREAEALPPGEERDALLREAHQLKTASQLNNWLSSKELRTPD